MSLEHSTTMGAAGGYPRRMGKTARRATYEDLLALDEQARAEVVEGRVVMLPSPSFEHQNAQGVLRYLLGGPFHDEHGRGGPGGWWLTLDFDVALAAHVIVRPDVVGWRREHSPRPPVRPAALRPDWVCEVVSPSNASHDLVTKRRLYAERGVPHYWLVDPLVRTLTALTLREGLWVEDGVFDDNDVARIAPFEAVELEVGRLFLPREEGEAVAFPRDDVEPTASTQAQSAVAMRAESDTTR
jgi:Uma2 family endonuclease